MKAAEAETLLSYSALISNAAALELHIEGVGSCKCNPHHHHHIENEKLICSTSERMLELYVSEREKKELGPCLQFGLCR